MDVSPQTYSASFYVLANGPSDAHNLAGINISLRSNIPPQISRHPKGFLFGIYLISTTPSSMRLLSTVSRCQALTIPSLSHSMCQKLLGAHFTSISSVCSQKHIRTGVTVYARIWARTSKISTPNFFDSRGEQCRRILYPKSMEMERNH